MIHSIDNYRAGLFTTLILFLLLIPFAGIAQQNDYEADLHQMDDAARFRKLSQLTIQNWKTTPAQAIIYGEESLEVAQSLNNKRFQAEALNNIGVAYSYANAFAEALDYFFNALVLREELGEDDLIATTLNNIGNVYYISGNTEQAISYYESSLAKKEASGQGQQVTSTLINLASLYNSGGQPEKALPNIFRAIDILEEQADSAGLSTAWNNLGRIYIQEGKLDHALEVNQKALQVSKQLNQPWDISYISTSIGEVYLEKQDTDKAKAYLNEGQRIARELQSRDLVLYSLRMMSVLHALSGNHSQFLTAFNEYDKLKDRIFSEENSRAIAEMQVIYKTEQREKENAIQKLQIAKERSLRNSFIFITIIVMIIVLFLYRRYRIKRKLNIKLEKEVDMRTADLIASHEQITRLNETLLSNTIETEERERKRFSEDLHDGLGPLLSTVKIHLELIASRDRGAHERKELIDAAHDLIDDAIENTKAIANNLTPNILSDFGLHEALDGYVQKINSMGGIQVDLQNDHPETRYSRHVELALYRISLELITNSLKHAKATHVKLKLSGGNQEIRLQYSDNGIGFDTHQLTAAHKGLGLSNIISRIKSINGKYEIYSGAESGFALEMSAAMP